jgi:hypothetical protein
MESFNKQKINKIFNSKQWLFLIMVCEAIGTWSRVTKRKVARWLMFEAGTSYKIQHLQEIMMMIVKMLRTILQHYPWWEESDEEKFLFQVHDFNEEFHNV